MSTGAGRGNPAFAMTDIDVREKLRRLASSAQEDANPVGVLFEHFDADRSGALSASDLRWALAAWGAPSSESEARLLVQYASRDDGGDIDEEAFAALLRKLSEFGRDPGSTPLGEALEKLARVVRDALGVVVTAPAGPGARVLARASINPAVLQMRYEVRGELPTRAEAILRELEQGVGHPFDDVLFCNIGNPHAVGGRPISFYREVLALADHPAILDRPGVEGVFAADAIARARAVLSAIPSGTGAYSHSQGVARIRRDVAAFVEARDGYPADPDDIFLVNGASQGITMLMQLLVAGDRDAILIPIPQYPIYTALIQLLGAHAVGYYLDEDAGWSLREAELERALASARARGLRPRAMVMINPGNPTGQCFGRDSLEAVLRFCHRNRLLLVADEVYQENVYRGARFLSAKRVLRELGASYDDVELVSFHSTSKGLIGECGRRGGYMELVGVDPEARAELYKLASVGLCPNLDGQVMTHLMVSPPVPGDPSHALFREEVDATHEALARKSAKVVEALSGLEGVSCQPVQGAMYVFPRLTLPQRAVEAAEAEGRAPDAHYCMSLLERTGICVVPGSGFGQAPGTWHLRMTFLPEEGRLTAALERLREHHEWYLREYGDP